MYLIISLLNLFPLHFVVNMPSVKTFLRLDFLLYHAQIENANKNRWIKTHLLCLVVRIFCFFTSVTAQNRDIEFKPALHCDALEFNKFC